MDKKEQQRIIDGLNQIEKLGDIENPEDTRRDFGFCFNEHKFLPNQYAKQEARFQSRTVK